MTATDDLRNLLAARVADLEEQYEEINKKLQIGSLGSVVTPEDYADYSGQCLALIDRAAGRHDVIYEQALREVERYDFGSPALALALHGLIGALKRELAAGLFGTIRETERADVLADLLQLAAGLLADQRKDAAAVLLGSVLVTHLRNIGVRNGLLPAESHNAGEAPYEALKILNAELAAVAYGKLAQQGVDDGLKLWHDATHAAAGSYTVQKVALFADWLRVFIAAHPA